MSACRKKTIRYEEADLTRKRDTDRAECNCVHGCKSHAALANLTALAMGIPRGRLAMQVAAKWTAIIESPRGQLPSFNFATGAAICPAAGAKRLTIKDTGLTRPGCENNLWNGIITCSGYGIGDSRSPLAWLSMIKLSRQGGRPAEPETRCFINPSPLNRGGTILNNLPMSANRGGQSFKRKDIR